MQGHFAYHSVVLVEAAMRPVEAATPTTRPAAAVEARRGRSAGVRRLEAQLTQTGVVAAGSRRRRRLFLLGEHTCLVALEVPLQNPASIDVTPHWLHCNNDDDDDGDGDDDDDYYYYYYYYYYYDNNNNNNNNKSNNNNNNYNNNNNNNNYNDNKKKKKYQRNKKRIKRKRRRTLLLCLNPRTCRV